MAHLRYFWLLLLGSIIFASEASVVSRRRHGVRGLEAEADEKTKDNGKNTDREDGKDKEDEKDNEKDTPSPTIAPATPSPTIAPATPSPTIAPATPSPTIAPATPTPTIAPATPSPTAKPSLRGTPAPSAKLTLSPSSAATEKLLPTDQAESNESRTRNLFDFSIDVTGRFRTADVDRVVETYLFDSLVESFPELDMLLLTVVGAINGGRRLREARFDFTGIAIFEEIAGTPSEAVLHEAQRKALQNFSLLDQFIEQQQVTWAITDLSFLEDGESNETSDNSRDSEEKEERENGLLFLLLITFGILGAIACAEHRYLRKWIDNRYEDIAADKKRERAAKQAMLEQQKKDKEARKAKKKIQKTETATSISAHGSTVSPSAMNITTSSGTSVDCTVSPPNTSPNSPERTPIATASGMSTQNEQAEEEPKEENGFDWTDVFRLSPEKLFAPNEDLVPEPKRLDTPLSHEVVTLTPAKLDTTKNADPTPSLTGDTQVYRLRPRT